MGDISFDWPGKLNPVQQAKLTDLYNSIIKDESILGYQNELNANDSVQIQQEIAWKVENGEQELMFAKYHGKVVGMVLLTPSKLPNCAHRVELSKGLISPDYRNKGILQKALLEIGLRARSKGYDQIVLDVRANTRSETVWRKAGFSQYGLLKDYARVGEVKYDGVFMMQNTDDLITRFTEIKSK